MNNQELATDTMNIIKVNQSYFIDVESDSKEPVEEIH